MTFSLGYDISPQNPVPNYNFGTLGYPFTPTANGFNGGIQSFNVPQNSNIRPLKHDTFGRRKPIANHKDFEWKNLLLGAGAIAAVFFGGKFAIKKAFKLIKTPFRALVKLFTKKSAIETGSKEIKKAADTKHSGFFRRIFSGFTKSDNNKPS